MNFSMRTFCRVTVSDIASNMLVFNSHVTSHVIIAIIRTTGDVQRLYLCLLLCEHLYSCLQFSQPCYSYTIITRTCGAVCWESSLDDKHTACTTEEYVSQL